MSNLPDLTDRYLSAQSVFDRFIRENEALEFYSRLGFMATEICLMVLEDPSMPITEMCERIAGIFERLSQECIGLPDRDADDLARAFRQCHETTLSLAAVISKKMECRNGHNS